MIDADDLAGCVWEFVAVLYLLLAVANWIVIAALAAAAVLALVFGNFAVAAVLGGLAVTGAWLMMK